MDDFRNGIRLGDNEDEYQAALDQYRARPGGVVVSLTRNRRNLYSLHDAKCETLSYPLEPQGQTRRSGKLLFRDRAELDRFHSNNRWLGKLNQGCRECPR
jgi:hypothetical protein